MVTDQFGAILQELAQSLGYKIMGGVQNSCLIPLPNGLSVQMEPDEHQKYLVLCIEIGTVPSGRYREELFQEALAYNGRKKKAGTFGYSEPQDTLLLFRKLSMRELNGEKVASAIKPLAERAAAWKQAVSKGELPPADASSDSSDSGLAGIMGLKP